ncbi:MAG: hypothetical protein H0U22_09135 [Geodermatophilaceae bacterium]|nr:hypothetical protein [Geodermatophilaceae bacterium]
MQPFDIEPGADIYGSIGARGARENSRRDVSLDIPKRKLTVFTGVSGSGKSSLVFGTIAAESQRLINQTYTAFPVIHAESRPARRRLADQPRRRSSSTKTDMANSRSTVGTATDTYSMLRIIDSRLGDPHTAARTPTGQRSARHEPQLRRPRPGRRSTSTAWWSATCR